MLKKVSKHFTILKTTAYRNIFVILLIAIPAVFFYKFFLLVNLPIPSDSLVGLYHPFRDFYESTFPRGVPFKNFLITDPVLQIYPWKELAFENLLKGQLPFWNPYEMTGKPLLGNFQSSTFYPLNILFLINPFFIGWSIFIYAQILLCGFFTYFFLSNLKVDNKAALFGALSFSFSGVFIVWLEWGTIGHTLLWLPLILLSIDKQFYYFSKGEMLNIKNKQSLPPHNLEGQKLNLYNKKNIIWGLIYILSLMSSFFAGHLQIFFYVFIFSLVYIFVRWVNYKNRFNILYLFILYNILFLILTSIQWIPTLDFILLSARAVDQSINTPGWFMPWEHLIQFIAPDFFGNPATNNYWGTWNYAEFVGYFGIVSLFFAVFAIFFRRDKKTLFFLACAFITLLFTLPNFLSYIPFSISIPFISYSQPTRLINITIFSLSIVASLGFDYFLKTNRLKRRDILGLIAFFIVIFGILWYVVLAGSLGFFKVHENSLIANRNLILPTVIFVIVCICLLIYTFLKNYPARKFIPGIFVLILIFELLRFGYKFTPFTQHDYLYPNTSAIDFLKSDNDIFRIMSLDRRIFPPNLSTHYRISSVEGYDPLYLMSYGEFVAALERGKPDISLPFGYNRIITPHNYESKIFDLLNVKYVLSLEEIKSGKFEKVFSEGKTFVYKYKNYLPRFYFVRQVLFSSKKEDTISALYNESVDLAYMAVVELGSYDKKFDGLDKHVGRVDIMDYNENRVQIKTHTERDGFLVFLDAYYPTWRAIIDNGTESRRELKIYKTNFMFRGVIIPAGNHTIEFFDTFSKNFVL